MKQVHRKITHNRLDLTNDVSHANQKRYLRAMKNGGRPHVVGRRLALRRGIK